MPSRDGVEPRSSPTREPRAAHVGPLDELETSVELTRSSLCSVLLEEGEEDLAVLIARADLPEILDSERHAPALAALGLDEEELWTLLPAVRTDPNATGSLSDEERAQLNRTISDRWAHLVDFWTGTRDAHT
jgi:hypothetical protein